MHFPKTVSNYRQWWNLNAEKPILMYKSKLMNFVDVLAQHTGLFLTWFRRNSSQFTERVMKSQQNIKLSYY